MAESKEGKTNAAWDLILHEIENDRPSNDGHYVLDASYIGQYREARLMAKHDTSTLVPAPLRKRNLNLLSISRKQYYVGEFNVFNEFPSMEGVKPKYASIPSYETLNLLNITSESTAINAFSLSGILDDFLKDGPYVETFNGRMGSGVFSFNIDDLHGDSLVIDVNSAQIEIDGGFESPSAVAIIEAKNIMHDDFNVRQLYYPYRRYLEIISKPIHLIFLQYTNHTYYLYEYRFADPLNFSSIELVQKAIYTFDDIRVSSDELWECLCSTDVIYDDNIQSAQMPFIQADRFDRIISLLERLSADPEGLTSSEVIDFMGLVPRQANYYPAAGEYLHLIDRSQRGICQLTSKGRDIMSLGYKERQLAFAGAMFEHQIFHDAYTFLHNNGDYPDLKMIQEWMRDFNVCGTTESTIIRRSQSVLGWLRWLESIIEN